MQWKIEYERINWYEFFRNWSQHFSQNTWCLLLMAPWSLDQTTVYRTSEVKTPLHREGEIERLRAVSVWGWLMMRGLSLPTQQNWPVSLWEARFDLLERRKRTKEELTHFIQNANSNSIVDMLLSQWLISIKKCSLHLQISYSILNSAVTSSGAELWKKMVFDLRVNKLLLANVLKIWKIKMSK